MRGLSCDDYRGSPERDWRTARLVRLQLVAARRDQVEMKVAVDCGLEQVVVARHMHCIASQRVEDRIARLLARAAADYLSIDAAGLQSGTGARCDLRTAHEPTDLGLLLAALGSGFDDA